MAPKPRSSPLLRSFRFYLAVISGLAAISLLGAYASREFTRVLDGLPWRNAVETTGTLQSVVTIPAEGSTRVTFGEAAQASPDDLLLVSYKYSAAGKEYVPQLKAPPAKFADSGGQPPETFPIYYQPASPARHVAFRDPRGGFWSAAVKLGIAAAIAAVVLATAVILLPKYGTADRVAPVATAEKLSWPGNS